ncbi:MAG: hypothetical protein Q8J96_09970 [Rhodocyclaceae bacterium]|jgi:hypothetical protein|nr:hypothetical protein [Rhodocyclaceae bacterium]
MLVYLGICAVLAFLAALFAALLAVPPAPTIHIAFAAGAMPLVFGAIIHFVPVLTRTATPGRPLLLLPLLVQLAGIATPLALAGILPGWSLHAAASGVALAALLLLVWITRRLRVTLGSPHPGARWYGAALLCLFFAVSLVPVWLARPELGAVLRLFHLHLNTVGFIGLAALGTLPVLVPTVLGRPDPAAAARLRRELPIAAGGVVLVAAGAAGGNPVGAWLSLGGAALLLWVVGNNLLAWRRTFGFAAIINAGAAASLLAATTGLALLLLLGMAHGLGLMSARPAIASFVAAFLLPLVTGALSHLLPVWRHPGANLPQRRILHARLAWGGRWRAVLFLAGGLWLAFDDARGWLPVAIGMLLFALQLLRGWVDRPEPSDDNSRPH